MKPYHSGVRLKTPFYQMQPIGFFYFILQGNGRIFFEEDPKTAQRPLFSSPAAKIRRQTAMQKDWNLILKWATLIIWIAVLALTVYNRL